MNCLTNKNKQKIDNVYCEDEEEKIQSSQSDADSFPPDEDIENDKIVLAILNDEFHENDFKVVMI
jgi:hypothetical protein